MKHWTIVNGKKFGTSDTGSISHSEWTHSGKRQKSISFICLFLHVKEKKRPSQKYVRVGGCISVCVGGGGSLLYLNVNKADHVGANLIHFVNMVIY